MYAAYSVCYMCCTCALVCTLRTVCVNYVVRALSTHPLKHGDVLEQICIRIFRTKRQSCDVIGQ